MESTILFGRVEKGVIIPSTEMSEHGVVEIEIKRTISIVEDTFGIWKSEKTGVDYVNKIRDEWKRE
ncbi:MAG: hypothetical protein MSIBF_06230 [Candidatus Altiarchaeales archaeon IMC4]|nr:MAG: hypothetical protein MSIBF_06230 [Candidatus Altiarchaeales archaeon IMC4]